MNLLKALHCFSPLTKQGPYWLRQTSCQAFPNCKQILHAFIHYTHCAPAYWGCLQLPWYSPPAASRQFPPLPRQYLPTYINHSSFYLHSECIPHILSAGCFWIQMCCWCAYYTAISVTDKIRERQQAVLRCCRTSPRSRSITGRILSNSLLCLLMSSGTGHYLSSEARLPKTVTFRILGLLADKDCLELKWNREQIFASYNTDIILNNTSRTNKHASSLLLSTE